MKRAALVANTWSPVQLITVPDVELSWSDCSQAIPKDADDRRIIANTAKLERPALEVHRTTP